VGPSFPYRGGRRRVSPFRKVCSPAPHGASIRAPFQANSRRRKSSPVIGIHLPSVARSRQLYPGGMCPSVRVDGSQPPVASGGRVDLARFSHRWGSFPVRGRGAD